jgi:hypothetical protein
MANSLQKLRRILPALVIRTIFAIFSHVTPLNAGEVPRANALADTSMSVVTVQAAPSTSRARMSAAGAPCVTSPTPCPA